MRSSLIHRLLSLSLSLSPRPGRLLDKPCMCARWKRCVLASQSREPRAKMKTDRIPPTISRRRPHTCARARTHTHTHPTPLRRRQTARRRSTSSISGHDDVGPLNLSLHSTQLLNHPVGHRRSPYLSFVGHSSSASRRWAPSLTGARLVCLATSDPIRTERIAVKTISMRSSTT